MPNTLPEPVTVGDILKKLSLNPQSYPAMHLNFFMNTKFIGDLQRGYHPFPGFGTIDFTKLDTGKTLSGLKKLAEFMKENQREEEFEKLFGYININSAGKLSFWITREKESRLFLGGNFQEALNGPARKAATNWFNLFYAPERLLEALQRLYDSELDQNIQSSALSEIASSCDPAAHAIALVQLYENHPKSFAEQHKKLLLEDERPDAFISTLSKVFKDIRDNKKASEIFDFIIKNKYHHHEGRVETILSLLTLNNISLDVADIKKIFETHHDSEICDFFKKHSSSELRFPEDKIDIVTKIGREGVTKLSKALESAQQANDSQITDVLFSGMRQSIKDSSNPFTQEKDSSNPFTQKIACVIADIVISSVSQKLSAKSIQESISALEKGENKCNPDILSQCTFLMDDSKPILLCISLAQRIEKYRDNKMLLKFIRSAPDYSSVAQQFIKFDDKISAQKNKGWFFSSGQDNLANIASETTSVSHFICYLFSKQQLAPNLEKNVFKTIAAQFNDPQDIDEFDTIKEKLEIMCSHLQIKAEIVTEVLKCLYGRHYQEYHDTETETLSSSNHQDYTEIASAMNTACEACTDANKKSTLIGLKNMFVTNPSLDKIAAFMDSALKPRHFLTKYGETSSAKAFFGAIKKPKSYDILSESADKNEPMFDSIKKNKATNNTNQFKQEVQSIQNKPEDPENVEMKAKGPA